MSLCKEISKIPGAHEKILLITIIVPQTDTGVLAEQAKAFTLIKTRELGKIAPYLRTKGWQFREKLLLITWRLRLFNKNIDVS